MKKFLHTTMRSAILLLFTSIFLYAAPFWEGKPFDWTPVKAELDGALKKTFVKSEDPRPLALCAVRLELSKVAPITPSRDPDWGKPMPDKKDCTIRTKRDYVRDFIKDALKNGAVKKAGAKQKKIIFACNTSPWRPWEAPFTHKYADFRGVLISNGVLVSDGQGKRDTFPVILWRKNGAAEVKFLGEEEDLSDIKEAFFGFGMLLKNGFVCCDEAETDAFIRRISSVLNPTIAIGLDADKKYAYVVCVDGRSPKYSEGAYDYETAYILRYFGASDGILLDGGGSSTVLVSEKGGRALKRINRVKGHESNAERPVGTSVAFFLKK